MELTEEQNNAIRSWVAEECGLAEIQSRLESEFGINMTYMDVRFLIMDMGLEIKEKPQSHTPDLNEAPSPPADELGAQAAVSGGVSVEVDRVTKPGSVVSGTAVMSDGAGVTWFLDQMGRLAMDAGTPGYRPSEADLKDFQDELRKALEKRGF